MKKPTTILTSIFAGGVLMAGLLGAASARAADTSAGTSSSAKESSAKSETSQKAADFIKETALANRAEIALANLAKQKAQNTEIKQFAELMQKEHQQSNDKLQSIAQAHGVELEQNLSWSQRRTEQKLEKLSGAEFDKEYATAMLKDHQENIDRFEKASQKITEADVKQFVQETLPTLRQHLQHAAQAAKSAGVDQSTISSYTKNMAESTGGTSDKSEMDKGATRKQDNTKP